jgi:hypothetical protein
MWRVSIALCAAALAWSGGAQAGPRTKAARAHSAKTAPPAPVTQPAAATTTLQQAQPPPIAPPAPPQGGPAVKPPPPPAPAVPPRRFGRFDLDQPFTQFRAMADLRACADALNAAAGRADCALPKGADNLGRAQIAWEDTRTGPELIALRLVFDPLLAPALTDLEWQLTRGWGPPVLEQLRRDKDQKFFTLQWEDAEHRATLEAAGPLALPSRAVAVVLERRQGPLQGEFAALHPRPFSGFRIRWMRRLEYDGQLHMLIWGTSLSPAQEAMGENAAAWAAQRNYVGLWRLGPATAQRPRRWRPLWERSTGGDDEEEPQRILYVDARDVTGDGSPDIEVELSCETCGATASEVIVKTVRAGKLVDLLSKRDLYRAQVELGPAFVKISEPEGEDDQGTTVSTYSYDRGKGAFVLAREERAPAPQR